MLKTILTGVTAYISTGLDYLIILMVIFGRVKHQDRWLVLVGDFLGTTVLVGSSLIVAFFLGFVPAPWLLGLLGLIPIYLGIKLWVQGDDDDAGEIAAKVAKPQSLIWNVALITVATCGADNIGIYVPIFTTVAPATIPLILLTFAVMVILFWEIGYRLACLPKVAEVLEKQGRYITIAVYLLIGLYILWDSGTIQHLGKMI
ncbi:cadmium resistance transporter [Levilactobacillus parabrevis]|uniref:Permease, cadmium resistance protein n=1 Tax=Levilactobacillus parabrevis ATCC 53295 TaxID=1267003 RepID=A0A0R1GT24_9LACO|nr:cadmium resistance transporter [Levilactobacillus parabrevis]KRK37371.1 permease, cadmium resistance protein [Levilactobacillus parabrevis ATCC 53295]KRO06822.1 permease, cadmium resistance protein [Levilactobacillus parabrevis]MCT4486928.1 permease [Levilactobacillus parabrevis]MCT4489503.1 permease [Levilactobacillus parabrevis]